MKPIISVIVLALLLTACTSLVDKGDKLFEAGEFEDAAEFYQRALRKDPNNVEATIGLTRAQEKIIDRGLIDVRMLRLSSNMEGATQKLEQIMRNQKAWDLQAQGAVAVTQNEETRFARSWLAQEGRRLAEAPFPDQYRYYERQYSFLISGSVPLKNELYKRNGKVAQKGEYLCQQLARNVEGQRFFLNDFTRKYCAMWQTPVSLKVDSVDKTRYQRLALNNSVQYAMDYVGHDYGAFNYYFERLNEAFRGSIWHSGEGHSVLRVNAQGAVRYSRHSRKIQRYANYTVSNKTKTKNAENEDIVKIHEEEKIHRYYARVYTENFFINITLATTVNGKPLVRGVNFTDSNKTESHNEDFPLAHLQPQSPSFMDLPLVFGAKVDSLKNEFFAALDQHWENSYCENNLAAEFGENVLRCAVINPDHLYVNSWFVNKFGLNYQQLVSLTGVD